jgi:hypothetical protein
MNTATIDPCSYSTASGARFVDERRDLAARLLHFIYSRQVRDPRTL